MKVGWLLSLPGQVIIWCDSELYSGVSRNVQNQERILAVLQPRYYHLCVWKMKRFERLDRGCSNEPAQKPAAHATADPGSFCLLTK